MRMTFTPKHNPGIASLPPDRGDSGDEGSNVDGVVVGAVAPRGRQIFRAILRLVVLFVALSALR
jgi:hypothetical protein